MLRSMCLKVVCYSVILSCLVLFPSWDLGCVGTCRVGQQAAAAACSESCDI